MTRGGGVRYRQYFIVIILDQIRYVKTKYNLFVVHVNDNVIHSIILKHITIIYRVVSRPVTYSNFACKIIYMQFFAYQCYMITWLHDNSIYHVQFWRIRIFLNLHVTYYIRPFTTRMCFKMNRIISNIILKIRKNCIG